MNLKESYRYANFLKNLLDTASTYLSNRSFVTKTKQTHYRAKANTEAIDEVIELPKQYDENISPNGILDFSVKVLKEQEALAAAIAKAKASTEINIDNAISLNKRKQSFISVLKSMERIQACERQTTGRGYKFDVNGEQKPYTYDITEEITIDFDRTDVKGLIKKYSKECDEVSAKLDEIEVSTKVDFEPAFDINDTFEDLVTA